MPPRTPLTLALRAYIKNTVKVKFGIEHGRWRSREKDHSNLGGNQERDRGDPSDASRDRGRGVCPR